MQQQHSLKHTAIPYFASSQNCRCLSVTVLLRLDVFGKKYFKHFSVKISKDYMLVFLCSSPVSINLPWLVIGHISKVMGALSIFWNIFFKTLFKALCFYRKAFVPERGQVRFLKADDVTLYTWETLFKSRIHV
jgi:hypothetical protein